MRRPGHKIGRDAAFHVRMKQKLNLLFTLLKHTNPIIYAIFA